MVGMIVAGRLSHNDDEQKRHNLAIESFTKARARFQEERIGRLDYINKTLRQRNHASQTFKDLDEAGAEYFRMTGQSLPPTTSEGAKKVRLLSKIR